MHCIFSIKSRLVDLITIVRNCVRVMYNEGKSRSNSLMDLPLKVSTSLLKEPPTPNMWEVLRWLLLWFKKARMCFHLLPYMQSSWTGLFSYLDIEWRCAGPPLQARLIQKAAALVTRFLRIFGLSTARPDELGFGATRSDPPPLVCHSTMLTIPSLLILYFQSNLTLMVKSLVSFTRTPFLRIAG